MELSNFKVKELSSEELNFITGGNWIKDLGRWFGEKTGQAMKFLSELDWTGSPLGY